MQTDRDIILKYIFDRSSDTIMLRESLILPELEEKHLERSTINRLLLELLDEGFLTDGQTGESPVGADKLLLTRKAVEYLLDKKIIGLPDFYDKLINIGKETDQRCKPTIEEYALAAQRLSELHFNIEAAKLHVEEQENKVKAYGKVIQEHGKILAEHQKSITVIQQGIEDFKVQMRQQMADAGSFKEKLIEIMGIFVAVFTLISINTGAFNKLAGTCSLSNYLSIILIINGTIIFSLIALLLGIKYLILKQPDDKWSWRLIWIPSALIFLGFIIPMVYR